MKKQLCAVLVAATLVLGQVPLSALASEDVVQDDETAILIAIDENEEEADAKSTPPSEEESQTLPLREQSENPNSNVSDEPLDTAEGPARSTGGQYAINMYYNTSWGTVVAKVDDVVTTSADGGDLVYLTITPASGYEFQSAGVIVRNSNQESVRTVPQADGTISFQMPNSAATVTVQFTIAEDDEPATPTPVDEVSLFVSQPAVGETTDAEAPDVTALDWMYEVTDTSWVDSSGNALSAPLTFESDATYYIAATVESYWESDATYFFPQSGDTAVSVENGSLVGTPSITNAYGAASTMQVLIAVQPVLRRSGDQIQVWVGSIDGNTTMAQSGGKVAVSYTPSEPNIYDFGKNGEYAAGDIVQFYSGDEITVTAQADAGHRFVGWYRVNIDYNMSGGDADHNGSSPNKAYSGSAFSTAASFTYKPGETVLSGDAEPLRYVCAVFEDDAAPSHNANEIQVWIGDVSGNEPGDGYAGGMVAVTYEPSYDDYPEDVVAKDGTVYERGPIFGCYEGDEVTLTARPDTGYRFAGWYLADGEWPANGAERYTGDRLSDQTSYTFEFTGANRLICAVFEENEAETGSVVVTLPANYLATLAVGNHAIAATFDDGEASASFSIKTADSSGNPSASNDPPTSSSLPKTGDPLRLIVPMLATMMIGGALLLALGVFALHGRRQGKHSRQ